MKKNAHIVLTVLAVSVLHVVGIVGLSQVTNTPTQLLETEPEMLVIDLQQGAAAGAASNQAKLIKAQPSVAPAITHKSQPENDVKRTVVKTANHQITEPNKQSKTPKTKPLTNSQKAQQTQSSQHANSNAAQQESGKNSATSGQGQSSNTNGVTNQTDSGNGNGGSDKSGNGATTGVKLAGTPSCLKPEYPAESVERGETGTVQVRWVVSARGGIVNVEVVGSSGNKRLDNAALRQAKKCRFSPALKNGIPVQNNYSRPYRFNL